LEDIDDLREFAALAIFNERRQQMLTRGAAWSIMRRDGALPPEAPQRLAVAVEADLADYGFSMLRAGLALREQEGQTETTRAAFERAANCFEYLVRNGDGDAPDRGYLRTIAAIAYHLAGYSAIAYSLFGEAREDLNQAPAEAALALLVLRDLSQLRVLLRDRLTDESIDDRGLVFALDSDHIDEEEALETILNSSVFRALAWFDFALQTGNEELVDRARSLLGAAQRLASDAGVVPLWWIVRLCRNMIEDLWSSALHNVLPTEPPAGGEKRYAELRDLFIATLYGRRCAEIELWPSQLEAARRASDATDDLVVALPTSAGKTRIAEITALMALSAGRRVLIVTPLRALSAQTERSFRKTFAPLGFTVSSLYGAAGMTQGDEDALRTRDIVIATPEKLDFALRNDATLINDVGLIVLDEGHMIGPSEREIRYETLVQRLLRRPDQVNRRIVCLSAILPDGEQLDDLTAWIRGDAPGEPVRSIWRPTRQRFGAITWGGRSAKLAFDLDEDGPFLPRFVTASGPLGGHQKARPTDTKELTLFAAWEFAEQGKRTLIFITQANWVESYGKTVVELVKRTYLEPLVAADDPAITRAVEVGTEWLGAGHPAVQCLKLGVAVHHGRLPNPFLRELELLLTHGVLKVIIASPTLSQGLNLNAAVLLAPILYRSGVAITGEEFANVAGRAGRAFVDVEGLIAHVIFDKPQWRMREWARLVASARSRALTSGLIQIIDEVIKRLAETGSITRDDAYEYLANAREAWIDPNEGVDGGNEEDDDAAETDVDVEPLSQLIEKLDATVTGLIEALDANSDDLPRLLDEALRGSLWARQIARREENDAHWHRFILASRARLIWSKTTPLERRGHFAMGVGLDAGLALDALAPVLEPLIDAADMAAVQGDVETLGRTLEALADNLLRVRPFVPAVDAPANWRQILRAWVAGRPVTEIGPAHMRYIEDAFAYRLVWALEAMRARRQVAGWVGEVTSGACAAILETGVPDYRMSMLVRAGLPSRKAAIAAIESTEPGFVTAGEMRAWLEGDDVVARTAQGDWPTAETAELWARFREESLRTAVARWRVHSGLRRSLDPDEGAVGLLRVERKIDDDFLLLTPDFRPVDRIEGPIQFVGDSLLMASVSDEGEVFVVRKGPGQQL
jgi:hypothetical protein